MRCIAIFAAGLALFLAGCESTPDRLFTYGARGVEIQAERLVASMYGLPAYPLPYGGPDIDRPLVSMRARWPEIKAHLDRGVLGMTEDGDVAIHDVKGKDVASARALRQLVKAENRDRDLLYRGMTAAIGHGGDTMQGMLGFTEDVFATEWAKQAPSGWWFQDLHGVWGQKP